MRRTNRAMLVAAAAAAMLGPLAAVPGTAGTLPQPVPEAIEGFATTLLVPIPVPTALAFGPGGADGPDLYATTLDGAVVRIALEWTLNGPVVVGLSRFAAGFSLPLGLIFDAETLYVSDSHTGAESFRTDGRVTRLDGTARTVVVDGVPNGRHNTNHLRFGPDGRLYIANGNPNDNGVEGGDADVFPYSGAILSVELAQLEADGPAVLHWVDDSGNAIPPDQIATHPRNADFASKVSVLAHGFRNIFGVAFAPTGLPYAGTAYTGMNGADAPSSQDALFRIEPGSNYGFPFCYNDGPPGGVEPDVVVVTNPTFPGFDCSGTPSATALLGWHTCATGLDFPAAAGAAAFPEAMQSSVFVGECAVFFADDWFVQVLADGADRAYHSTSHKVVRVELDATGRAVSVNDFVTGLALPTDVLFGPDGAMYIADAEALYRVAPVVAPV